MVTEDRRGGFLGDANDMRGLPDGGDVIGVQRHLEQPREDLGKGVMTVLEDSSGSLIRTACTALVYLFKAPTTRLLRQTFLSVLLAAHLQHSGSSPAAVAQRIRAVYSNVVGLTKEVCDVERPSKDHCGASYTDDSVFHHCSLYARAL